MKYCSKSGRQVTVWPSAGFPLANYARRPLEEATRDAETLGFGLEQQGEDSLDFPRGIIFGQDPEPGTLLPLNGPVTVKVSRGWPVPEFVGKAEPVAEGMAEENRIRLAKTVRDNFEVPLGTAVRILVSDGWPTPNFLALEETAAISLAAEKAVALAVVERRRDRNAQPGIVIGQDPPPATRLLPEQVVNLVVSSGYPTPRFIGLAEAEARALAAGEDVIPDTTAEAHAARARGCACRVQAVGVAEPPTGADWGD